MALMEHRYVVPGRALALVPRMPIDDKAQRTIRRWAKALLEAGAASINKTKP